MPACGEGGSRMEEPRITLAITGDVMLGRLMDDVLQRMGPRYPWGNTLPLLRRADLTLVNLECVIATSGSPWDLWPKAFHFRAGPIALEALRQASVDFASLANNHVLDYGEEALLEMLDRLDSAGIAHAGAGRNLVEAARPAFLQAGELRVAILAFTDNEPGWAATEDRPGINYLPANTEPESLDRVRGEIATARHDADLVVVSNHWGPNMRLRPTERFRRLAHAVIEAGADLYIGHSAHVLQGVEVYRGKLIIYDAGDFVDDYSVDPELHNDWSALFRCTAQRSGVVYAELIPTLIAGFQVNPAYGSAFDAIAARLQELSGELGTGLTVRGGALVVDLIGA